MTDSIGYRAQWVLAILEGRTGLVPDAVVVVQGNEIAGILPPGAEGAPDQTIDLGETLLMPGFINAHTHCVSGPLFRGLIEDHSFTAGPGSVIEAIMLPLGDIVSEVCTSDSIQAIAGLGQLEALKAGATTIIDMPRTKHEAFAEAAGQIGLRAYIHPYLMSAPKDVMADGDEAEVQARLAILESFGRWHDQFDGSYQGRIRIGLGPHAPDTCSPALLRAVARVRDEYGVKVTIHAAQSPEEMKVIAARFNASPIGHLDHLGLLTSDLIAAHCVYADDTDLRLLAERGVAVAHCPLSFARIGTMVPFYRFAARGVSTLMGSDAHALDILADIRLAAINSKFHTGDSGVATARELVRAATEEAADAIGRSDLGRLRKGAAADIVGISLASPHLQPIHDPIKTVVWNGSGQDVGFVMVAGAPLVHDGIYVRSDERMIVERGAAALREVWDVAWERGILPGKDEFEMSAG